MPTSADLVRIAIVPEVVYGTTPANPAFKVVRLTGESLAFAPTTTVSNEMNPNRMVTDSILTGGQSSGDINFELAYEDWFEDLIEAAMCSTWYADQISIGTLLRSFTIEKTIPVQGGTTQYHRFTGCTINGFSLNIAPNQPITGTISVLGKAVTTAEAAISGATYADPALTPVMAAPRVVNIEVGGVPAVSQCFNNLTITLNNNNRTIECIGTLGARETVLGRAEITTSFSVLFTDSTLLETLIDQTETSLSFQTNDTSDAVSPSSPYYYTWNMPRVKFTADPVVASGTNADVVNAVTAQALLDPVTDTALIIGRYPRA